jgi:hypothetical protein
MSLAIVNDVQLHGILPMHEIVSRASAGKISGDHLSMLLLGRIAEDVANALPDGSAYLDFWTGVSGDVFDWFSERNLSRDLHTHLDRASMAAYPPPSGRNRKRP